MPRICNKTYPTDSETLYSHHFAKYPYPLSDFQKYAIEAIVTGQHVLSCAHTGSGKTLAAEFAIEYFVSQGKKVIYTSPIKALSNQKYYEFSQKYPHISFGLLTGDIKTNPMADVLIMTTEILMNRLFCEPGANANANAATSFQMDLQTELACVVFDEVHYINDADRGNVWEQTIMMLPQHVQMVMLSATIDNPVGFAEWCEQAKSEANTQPHTVKSEAINEVNKQVWLSSTNFRVVPLTHYVYYATTEDPFKKIKDKAVQEKIRAGTNRFIEILSPKGKFNPAAHQTMCNVAQIFNRERIFIKRKFVLNSLVQMLRDPEKSVYADSEKEKLPAIVFVFSRKLVEECAHEITTPLLEFDSKVAYTMRHECEQIVRKFPNAREYLELPEFNDLVGLLEKGIAIHHSGMIPVLREIVELMISKKRVKLLFATESFAIGLDCPIRTAVFMNLSKHTATGLRNLESHEYTQMAGRAGRRGIDTVGHVIHLNNLFREQPSLEGYKRILCGSPQVLASKFKVTPQVVLNLVKNGMHTVDSMTAHLAKTMLAKENDKMRLSYERQYDSQHKVCDAKRELLGTVTVTDDICAKYAKLKEQLTLSMLNAKSRKNAEKEIETIVAQYPTISADANVHMEYKMSLNELESISHQIDKFGGEIRTKLQNACDSLCKEEILVVGTVARTVATRPETDAETPETDAEQTEYHVSPAGIPALYVAEIDPVFVVKLIRHTDWFQRGPSNRPHGAVEFAQLFSCFTQIKVDAEYVKRIPNDSYIAHVLEAYTGFDGNNGFDETAKDAPHYDLYDEIAEWCGFETELDCKIFIQTVLAEKGISIGDFTKAILKIATIAREWAGMCEMCGQIGVQSELVKVEGMVLKYIATAQSLYV